MEIGITLAPQHQGQGYGGETIGCLLDYCFTKLCKHRVFACTDVRNKSAITLLQRKGFRQEAHFIEHRWFKGEWCSEFIFAMLRREWTDTVKVL
jgi:RimJ/RimL family protein N-acetyltransferase